MKAEIVNCKKRSKFEPQKVFSELEFVFFQTTYRIDRKTMHKQETQQTKHNEI